jgi:hypothetical protein
MSCIYDGYVLKYVGDAVIASFAPGSNIYLTYDKAIRSAKSMIDVITNGINPVLNKYDYPDLYVKIGIDEEKVWLFNMRMIKALKSIYLDTL